MGLNDFAAGNVFTVNKNGDPNHGRAVRMKERDGNTILVRTRDGKEFRYTEAELIFLTVDTRRD
jgi:co-chaperonin GroES (HSP10)